VSDDEDDRGDEHEETPTDAKSSNPLKVSLILLPSSIP